MESTIKPLDIPLDRHRGVIIDDISLLADTEEDFAR
jgi:hypothetical protein